MKKLRLLPLFLGILAVTIVSCDSVDFGNINKDDDAPQEANVEGLMAGAMNQYFTLYGRSYHSVPTLYSQYQTQSVYTSAMRYGTNPRPWEEYYTGVLSNFSELYEMTHDAAGDPAIEAFGKAENQAAVAEIMTAMVFKRVADTWGPIPYRSADGKIGEGLNAEENKAPAYTDQKVIYSDLIKRLQAARDMIIPGADGPTGDVLYGGEMESWQKFANSLIMQIALQINDEAAFDEAYSHSAGYIDEVKEEAWYNFQNSSGAINPFSQLRGSDYYLAEPFTDALSGTTPSDSSIVYSNTTLDERIYVFSSDTLVASDKDVAGQDTTYQGAPYGVDNGGLSGPSIAGALTSADSDLPFMTAAYTLLNVAEAADKGWVTDVTAAEMLEDGIIMSYATIEEHWDDGNPSTGNLLSDGSTFAAQRLLDATNGNAVDGIAQVIAEEKWVALFPMGFASWTEWRRTTDKAWGMQNASGYEAKGYPGLYPAPDATNGGILPRRYIYPSTESSVNEANYKDGVSRLTPADDQNTSSLWWQP